MMTEGRKNQSVYFDLIDVHAIDPSPFQRRRFFDEEALRELGASIARDGLVEPIIVRPAENGRFQLIAGERRVKAVKQYTDRSAVQTKIIDVNDSQARRMSAAENLQRKDLSALEAIETTVDIVDAELSGEKPYLAGGKTPLERVHKCLTLLDSIRRGRDRGSAVSGSETALSHQFMGQVETIFKNLPKPLEWRSFLNNDLVLLTDIPEIVQNASIKYGLNKAQTKALARLEQVTGKDLCDVIQKGAVPVKGRAYAQNKHQKLNEISAHDIQAFAEHLEKARNKAEQEKEKQDTDLCQQVKVAVMTRLGIPLVRIAKRLDLHRETAANYARENTVFKHMDKTCQDPSGITDIAENHGIPQALVWSEVLKGKTDRERFKALGWGLRTWDHWYFNDVDKRFGDPWPGRIPAQLVGHTLFYFTRQNDLVLDPMAGGGVVADTCLALGRRCWSFDLLDRVQTRPEIEPFLWDFDHLDWPVKTIEKPDLIFFDPPYFKKMADHYEQGSISDLPKAQYLEFFRDVFSLMRKHARPGTRIAFLNADFREFQGVSALEENPENAILMTDYAKLLESCGWQIIHLLDCPLSAERFTPTMVSRMQSGRSLGTVRRTLIVGKPDPLPA
jgi:hypothetical protein